jgi:Rrf2 family protein
MSPSPGWFAVAVRALVVLARSQKLCPSQAIACNVQAHAVFTRRVLAQLVRAGLVEAREGRDGGYRLGRSAATITLADVFRAVQSGTPLDLTIAPTCVELAGLRGSFTQIAAEAEAAVIAVLDGHTIAELAGSCATTPPAV